jgi:hypothetical protein
MNMLRIIPAILIAAACGGASAQTLYKCTLNGKITYAVAPCKEGTMKTIEVPPAPKANPNREQELKREAVALAALQKARAEREALEQHTETEQAKGAREQRCAALRTEVQEAEQNAAGAPGPLKASRRAEAEKKAEAMAAECGS